MVDRYIKNDVGITVGHLPQNVTFYKNSMDFNIANWAKILMIKTHYTVIDILTT